MRRRGDIWTANLNPGRGTERGHGGMISHTGMIKGSVRCPWRSCLGAQRDGASFSSGLVDGFDEGDGFTTLLAVYEG